MDSEKRVLIMDGYGLIYRAYFAFMNRPMTNKDGENISAVFGFFRMFFSILKNEQPSHLVVTMDSIGPTFRHELYGEYKANREKTPDDLRAQIPMIEEILLAAGVPVLRKNGFEADDLIATIARKAERRQLHSVIVSSDKDLLQLVGGSISAIRPKKGEMAPYDRDTVFEEFGIWPEQIVDYLSLIGDSSDNVPGVRGIGPKGAVKLLTAYGTLEGVYEHVGETSPSVRKKLLEHHETALLSKRLVVLDDEAEIEYGIEDLLASQCDYTKMIPHFQKIGSKALVTLAGGDRGEVGATDRTKETAKRSLSGEGKLQTVTDSDTLRKVLMKARDSRLVAFDIETDDIDSMVAVPVGFSVSYAEKEAWYIPLVAGSKEILDADEVKAMLRPLLEDPAVQVIGQNIKYDFTVLRRWGIEIANLYFDTMIAAWMLDSSANTYNMDRLAEAYLGYKTTKFSDIVPKGSLFPEIDLSTASEYAAEDADITYRLYVVLSEALRARGLDGLFFSMEMPLLRIIADMEFQGMYLLPENLSTFGKELEERIRSIEQLVFEECGKTFNMNSPKQLQAILFDERGLTPIKKTKTGYSTDTSVLEELAKVDVVPSWILEHRGLVKLKNTYVDSLPTMIDPRTKRIHTSLVQTGTATGRLSSKNPNLQNIPIRSEDGRRIRSAFIPSEGYRFMSADYSQIELVVLAHFADDAGLKEAFRSGTDVHRYTGSLIFDVPSQEVTDEQRRIAKTINFGVMYGMSAFRLSRELDIPRKQADEFIKAYFSRYSGIRKFMERVVEDAEATGVVKTLSGHERAIPGIRSRNRTEKAGAERIAVNTPIQGTAADIMKSAMIAVSREMKGQGVRSRMILQVHDELIFEVPEEETELMEKLVRGCMEQVMTLSVPLRVSIEFGESWGDMH